VADIHFRLVPSGRAACLFSPLEVLLFVDRGLDNFYGFFATALDTN
jgi:hypothetical protein